MLDRIDIVLEARTWLGVTWKHQGRNRNGIDCGGFILKVANALDVPMRDAEINYRRNPVGHDFTKYFAEVFDRINPLDLLPGDVPLFRSDILPCHCGFVTDISGRRGLIHANVRPDRKVVEHTWTPGDDTFRVTHAFRFKGLS